MTPHDYEELLAVLSAEELQKFNVDFGGGEMTVQQRVREFVDHPKYERRICQLLGLQTEKEKLTEASVRSKMTSDGNTHGEPPAFAKWLIWLFRKETWKERPFIASIGSIVAICAVCSTLYGVYRLFPTGEEQTRENLTWKRNYQFFASRIFPIITDAKNIGDPPGSGEDFDLRADFLRDLGLLVLHDEPEIQSKREQLTSMVKEARTQNDLNPGWFLVDYKLAEAYRDFKNHLRDAAARHGVDVEQLEREKYIEPD